MSAVPQLTASQWRRIENILAQTRRDPLLISALLYLEHSGQSLRHVAEVFGVTKTRLNEWHRALAADGSLAKVMANLKLTPAGPLVRRGGGGPEWYARPGHEAQAAAITAIRLLNFAEALRAGR